MVSNKRKRQEEAGNIPENIPESSTKAVIKKSRKSKAEMANAGAMDTGANMDPLSQIRGKMNGMEKMSGMENGPVPW